MGYRSSRHINLQKNNFLSINLFLITFSINVLTFVLDLDKRKFVVKQTCDYFDHRHNK